MVAIPDPPTTGLPAEWLRYFEDLSKAVRQINDRITPGNNRSLPFTEFANLTDTRTLDADATTTDELADVLGTLIKVLKGTQIIK